MTSLVNRLADLARRANDLADEIAELPPGTTTDESFAGLVEDAGRVAKALTSLREDVRAHQAERGGRALIDALIAAGYTPRSYLGRGMYAGQRCVSVSVDTLDMYALGRDLAEVVLPGDGGSVPCPSTDALGLGTVAYWRTIPWPDGRPHDDDDEPEHED